MKRTAKDEETALTTREALIGLDEIIEYARTTKKKIVRWRAERGFPAWFDGEMWYSSRSQIDEWWRSQI